MIAIFRRELRNNGKWAIIAMAAFATVVAIVLLRGEARNRAAEIIWLSGVFGGLSSIGSGIVGFVLGMLAVWPDCRAANWSLLASLPISRRRNFLGKLAAALVLYAGAAGLPVLGIVVWTALPGQLMAPFDWHMGIPRLAELLGGAVCLCAGMLTVARRGKLLASRPLPALSAILVFHFVETTPMALPTAFFLFLAAAAVFAMAAYGAFAFAGEFEPQPVWSRFLQTVALAGGAGLMLFIGAGIVLDSLEAFHPQFSGAPSTLELSTEGQVLLNSPQGFTVPFPDGGPAFLKTGAIDSAYAVSIDVSWPGEPARHESLWYSGLDYTVPVGWSRNTAYYYVPGRQTIEAFDERSLLYAGSLGPGGFVPAPQTPQTFPEPLHVSFGSEAFSDQSVWLIWPGEPGDVVRKIYTAPAGERILGAASTNPRDLSDLEQTSDHQIVVTQATIHVIDAGSEIARIPIDRHMWGFDELWYAHPRPDRFFLLCLPQRLWVEADGSGKIIDEKQLPPLPPPEHESWLPSRIATAITAPPLLAWTDAWHPVEKRDLWMTACSAMVAAGIGCWLLRRYEMTASGTCVWIAVCLALGWAGVILLLCTRTAIVRVKCPACGRGRFITQARCRHCGAPFPPPPRSGVEIFQAKQPVGAAT